MCDVRLCSAVSIGVLLYSTTVLAAVALLVWMVSEVTSLEAVVQPIALKRLIAGGVVSPIPAILCIVCGLLVTVLWDRNRDTRLGKGYRHLYQRSRAFRYLLGADGPTDANMASLVATLETPLPSLRTHRLLVLLFVTVALIITLGRHGATLDGPALTRFLLLGTFTILLRATLLVLQVTQTWRRLRACLGRMKHEAFMPAVEAVRSRHVSWDVSLFEARVGDLRPIVRLAQRLCRGAEAPACASVSRLYVQEVARCPKLPLAVSQTWIASWSLAETCVGRLRQSAWASHGTAAAVAVAARKPEPESKVTDAELYVAIHLAFILRDMLSHTVSTIGNALSTIGLLTLAHLLYMFQGRSVFLMVDMLFLIAAASVALWLLVGIERDHVISTLRDTRPGRVEFNGAFVKGVAAYVVLPVVVALAAVFPEVGVHFTSLLDPIRRVVGE